MNHFCCSRGGPKRKGASNYDTVLDQSTQRRLTATPILHIMWHLLVHAVNTSGEHARERRGFQHRAHCVQCGAKVGARGAAVAAHVARYRWPILCPSRGSLTLATTCRACNSVHQSRKQNETCCTARARVLRFGASRGPPLGRVSRLWCWRHVHTKSDPSEQDGDSVRADQNQSVVAARSTCTP